VSTVWIPPSATSFSCLCETCLDRAREQGDLFGDAIRLASVRGRLDAEADVAVVRCGAGHELVVRRVDRPPTLAHQDARQLQIS
jgi:hypothetical protein